MCQVDEQGTCTVFTSFKFPLLTLKRTHCKNNEQALGKKAQRTENNPDSVLKGYVFSSCYSPETLLRQKQQRCGNDFPLFCACNITVFTLSCFYQAVSSFVARWLQSGWKVPTKGCSWFCLGNCLKVCFFHKYICFVVLKWLILLDFPSLQHLPPVSIHPSIHPPQHDSLSHPFLKWMTWALCKPVSRK